MFYELQFILRQAVYDDGFKSWVITAFEREHEGSP